jgi:enoyl-[acyl-carrier protein] reductase I
MGGRFMKAPKESILSSLEVGAVSLKTMSNALIPLFEARGGGSIVGMTFDTSAAWPGYDWMGVTKTTLEAVNRYLALNLGPYGVRANLVRAGMLLTESGRAIPNFELGAKVWERQAPVGWDATDPYPVADAVCFLLSDAARGISGEILNVDGGRHAVSGAINLVDEALAEEGSTESVAATGVETPQPEREATGASVGEL